MSKEIDLKVMRIDHMNFIASSFRKEPEEIKELVLHLCQHVLQLIDMTEEEYENEVQKVMVVLEI